MACLLLQDKSAAFFATGNVAISRRLLLKAGELLGNAAEGPFDADFSEYGWEDLELGGKIFSNCHYLYTNSVCCRDVGTITT
jgi:hypothetical protein